jgi:hypothetical protein
VKFQGFQGTAIARLPRDSQHRGFGSRSIVASLVLVKIRAGRRYAAERDFAQHRPCVHVPSPHHWPAPWAPRTQWHLEGLTTKAYRASREIQLI